MKQENQLIIMKAFSYEVKPKQLRSESKKSLLCIEKAKTKKGKTLSKISNDFGVLAVMALVTGTHIMSQHNQSAEVSPQGNITKIAIYLLQIGFMDIRDA